MRVQLSGYNAATKLTQIQFDKLVCWTFERVPDRSSDTERTAVNQIERIAMVYEMKHRKLLYSWVGGRFLFCPFVVIVMIDVSRGRKQKWEEKQHTDIRPVRRSGSNEKS